MAVSSSDVRPRVSMKVRWREVVFDTKGTVVSKWTLLRHVSFHDLDAVSEYSRCTLWKDDSGYHPLILEPLSLLRAFKKRGLEDVGIAAALRTPQKT